MQYDVNNPNAYLEALDDDWRKEKLETIRSIIQTKAPDLAESIQYKMLAFGKEGRIVFHLNAQKNHVGLYVGDINKIDPEGELLQGLDVGKGCIRLKKSNAIGDTQLEVFIDKTLRLWKAGEDIEC